MPKQAAIIFILCASICAGLRNTIYLNVKTHGYSFCFTKLNATDMLGCSWDLNGNVGNIYLMLKESDAVISNLTPESGPYIVVLSMKMLAKTSFMLELNKNPLVKGVVVPEPQPEDLPSAYSVDSDCPNAEHSLYKESGGQCSKTKWNPNGNDYFFRKWNFPIILLHKSEGKVLEQIISCSKTHNGKNATDDRRCAIEIKSTMNAVKDSRVCLRRNYYSAYVIQLSRFCDIMHGRNLHVINTPLVEASKGVILITARSSSLSLFTDSAKGAYSVTPAVGIWIALASALSSLGRDETTQPKKQVIFSLLDGESMDYYGSTKFVDEIRKKVVFGKVYKEDMKFSDIDTIIDLNQLGNGAANGAFYVHTLTTGKSAAKNLEWANKISANKPSGSKISVEVLKGERYPPTSIQSFLKYSTDFSSILISDYRTSYVNHFYNSFLDDKSSVNENNLYDLASSIYKSLVETVYSKTISDTKPLDKNAFRNVTMCLYNVTHCEYLKQIFFNANNLPDSMDQSFRLGASAFLNKVIYFAFYLTGSPVPDVNSKDDCNAGTNKSLPEYTYKWIPGPNYQNKSGICWRGLQLVEDVKFITEDDAWTQWNTTEFSFWTESQWSAPSVRVFLTPSKRWETVVLSTGIIVTLVSILLIVLLLKRFDDLFPGTIYMAGTIVS